MLTRTRPVVLLEISNVTSGIGNGIVLVVLPWLVLEKTGSAAAAGLVAGLSSLTAVFFVPLTGAAIDRFGRKRMSVLSDAASALSVVAFPVAAFLDALSLPVIIVLACIGAGLDPAGYTARKSLIVNVTRVSGIRLTTLNGVHEALFALGWTVGPLLGALLISAIGATQAFWVAGGLFVCATGAVVAIRLTPAAMTISDQQSEGATWWRDIVQGFTSLWSDRALRTMTVAIMLLAGVYMPSEGVVLPVYFEALSYPQGLGFVIGAMAGGTVIGAFGYGWLRRRLTLYRIVVYCLIGTVLSIFGMAFLPGMPWLAILGFLLGFSWGPMQPLLNELVQERIPENQQGRVFSIQLTAFYVFPPLAMLVTGVAVESWGVHIVYPLIAIAVLLISVPTLFLRNVRALDS